MVEKKNRLIGLWILVAVILLVQLYYWYPVYTGTWEEMDSLFEFSAWGLFVWLNIFLDIILVISITYGFYKRRNWARVYTIAYFVYSSFWAIISMFVWGEEVILHYIYFIVYVVVIGYLLLSHVKDYFKCQDYPSYKESGVYRYGDYTLYKQKVKTKAGTSTRYYFRKTPPADGEACSLPDKYTVGINSRNGMPYLKLKK